MLNTAMNVQTSPFASGLAALVSGYSIEVMPRTASKIEDFRSLLPAGTRVYIAHIEGTRFDEMLDTAKRISSQGFDVMPHLPARGIKDQAELENWLNRYREEAGIDQALLLGGGIKTPAGEFTSSMDMIETGLFEKYGFSRLHVAGHPEGNKDIDHDGSTTEVDKALLWKQDYARRSGVDMAIVTQFAFDAAPVIAWAERIAAMGVTLPIHAGVSGPAKLQTLLRFAVACGVGPSLQVLQRRARDITRLLLPHEPLDILTELADYRVIRPDTLIEKIHFFPLGGIGASAEWANAQLDG